MAGKEASLIREPEGVDLVVSHGGLDRQTALETAEWLAAYRRQHDQSEELREALEVLRHATAKAATPSNSASV
jgi:hypothetical protein